MALTATIKGTDVAERLSTAIPGVVLEANDVAVVVPAERVVEAALFLRDDPELDCKFLNNLAAVDWQEYFEVVYHLSSLVKNHTLVLKARAAHDRPVVPSLSRVWMGAMLQEREAYDLMGIVFEGHPSLARIFLWEGFPGHPLRKDFLALPGGHKPGLQRFPFEFPGGQRNYPEVQGETPVAPRVPRLDQPPAQAIPVEQSAAQAEEVASRVRAEEARPPRRDAPAEGAGSDVSRAGGTAEQPGDPQKEEERP